MPKEYHFLKEIGQQPEVIKKSLEHADPHLKELAQRYAGQVKRVILVGCGDPYMLGLCLPQPPQPSPALKPERGPVCRIWGK